jgi:predicted phosphodiesterase
MDDRRRRCAAATAALLLGLLLVDGCDVGHGSGSSSSARPHPSSSASTPGGSSASGDCSVAAAGDVAGDDDYRTGAQATADLIAEHQVRAVIAVGDLAYDQGTSEEFADYYDPTWGAFKDKTLAVPGNHDNDDGAGGYSEYFGHEAGDNRAVTICGWRIRLVNQYAGIDRAASFITADAADHSGMPSIVVWHQPRFSSGDEHGSDQDVQPLWEAAVASGVDIVLNGHDHDYERFAKLDEAGTPDPEGTREFVTGLGGHHIRGYSDVLSSSEAHFTGTPAVLFLELRSDGYSWAERTTAGDVVDQGTE